MFCLLNFSNVEADDDQIWQRYIDFTIGQQIYYLYYAALDAYKLTGRKALVLGSGAGNEDIKLLRNE